MDLDNEELEFTRQLISNKNGKFEFKKINRKEKINMNGVLETHFKLIDYAKSLLFSAMTKQQEEQARHILELAKSQEKNLIIM